ncbi:hypothetical protein TRFO_02519 [Tritrichomonas foetus]|uniref:Ubiquitin fusion degradation protein n=1 Tax=Tritrichomonas foetus TaxID=1144522 RepID=A0A1J4L252_9EUKA|nr:hypothetical protein TRFO_02519 [Tritrichomonas foetus]|eukprot:OHT17490.1 hypothetical protein TRFO_02519 [Tritrichomonas foetus]
MNFTDTLLAISAKTFGRPELDTTGKILLPETLLDRIMKSNFNQQVMYFLLRNPRSQQQIAAGIESFTSDRASAVIPSWMMQYIDISENDKVQVSLQNFPTATSVTFQPFSSEFYDLPNFRVILEYTLRQMPCLTQGAVVPVPFNNKIYKIKVLKVEPKMMVSCLHADLTTDVAQPLDTFDHHWGEEEENYEPAFIREKKAAGNPAFRGKPHSLK